MKFFEVLLLGMSSVYSGATSIFSKNTLENKTFVDKFKNDEDKKLLYKTINDLKAKNQNSKEITLSNKEIVKIVVN